MSFFRLAYRIAFRNVEVYLSHIFNTSLSVLLFFNCVVLRLHPNLFQGESVTENDKAVQLGLYISQYLVLVFSLGFVLYVTSSFLKKRKEEFGVFLTHGISPKQLNRLITTESMVIGASSIIIGISIGLVTLFLISCCIDQKIFYGNNLFIAQAVQATVSVFVFMFFSISFFVPWLVRKTNPIVFLQRGEDINPEKKIFLWLSVFTVITTFYGYIEKYYYEQYLPFSACIIGIAFITTGMYFFFAYFGTYLSRTLQSKHTFVRHKKLMLIVPVLTLASVVTGMIHGYKNEERYARTQFNEQLCTYRMHNKFEKKNASYRTVGSKDDIIPFKKLKTLQYNHESNKNLRKVKTLQNQRNVCIEKSLRACQK